MIDKKTRYYSLTVSNHIKEYSSIQDLETLNDIAIGIIDKFKKVYRPPYGNDYRLSEIILYDPRNKTVGSYSINNWKIDAVEIIYRAKYIIESVLTISDPEKVIRDISCKYKCPGNAKQVFNTDLFSIWLSQFHAYTAHTNWLSVDIYNENIDLKKKINSLQDK